MDSSRGNPSPSDPMESVWRYLAPYHIADQFYSSTLRPFPVPVVIGLDPQAGKGNLTQVGCIGHVWSRMCSFIGIIGILAFFGRDELKYLYLV